ncbi:MAG TPA: hypothetical protein VGV89_08905 [Thermoplasmata archaeon]|nr:hypothetical protein [Thermoplasmata archaeon]
MRRLREQGSPEARLESQLETVRRMLRSGDLRAAAEGLTSVDEELARRRGESELTEFPRGLVGYVPIGDRGRPLEPEDEAIAHRRRLVLHLTDLTPLAPEERQGILSTLREAERAIEARDRTRAKRLVDEAHTRLEAQLARRAVDPHHS